MRWKRVALTVVGTGTFATAFWAGCTTFGDEDGNVTDAASTPPIDSRDEVLEPDAGTLSGLPPRDSAVQDVAVVPPEGCDAGPERNDTLTYENIDPIELKYTDCDLPAMPSEFRGESNPSLLTVTNGGASLGFGPGLGATPWLGQEASHFVGFRDEAGTSLAVVDEAGVSVSSHEIFYPPNAAATTIFSGVLYGERAPWLTKTRALYTAVGGEIYKRSSHTSIRPTQSAGRVASPVVAIAADYAETLLVVTRTTPSPSVPAVDFLIPACGRWQKTASISLVGFDATGFRAVVAVMQNRNTLLVSRRCTDLNPRVCCLARAVYRP